MAGFQEKAKLLLFENEKYVEGGKLPNRNGFGEIDKASLARINAAMDAGPPDDIVKFECAAWEKISSNGNPYLFVSFDIENPKYAKPRGGATHSGGATHGGSDEVPF